jgi:glutamate racemase
MKIGIFDSGLGGLLVAKSLMREIPQYDYVFLGDTKRVPYGNRSHDTIYEFLQEAVGFLFQQDCKLIIVACNTASAQALRQIQQEYLPKHYPDRRVLGVLIPACEAALENPQATHVGILATSATVESKAFVRELRKISPRVTAYQRPAPLLVPFIENDEADLVSPVLRRYLSPFKGKIDTLILGCTHYPILKRQIASIMGKGVRIISQDELVPDKLKNYLKRHPEIESTLSRNKTQRFLVTDLTPTMSKMAKAWFEKAIPLETVDL